MIYIRIEMWPGGDQKRSRLLAEGTIANTGTGTEEIGVYKYDLSRVVQDGTESRLRWKRGVVSGFPRLRQNVWQLLQRCLKR